MADGRPQCGSDLVTVDRVSIRLHRRHPPRMQPPPSLDRAAFLPAHSRSSYLRPVAPARTALRQSRDRPSRAACWRIARREKPANLPSPKSAASRSPSVTHLALLWPHSAAACDPIPSKPPAGESHARCVPGSDQASPSNTLIPDDILPGVRRGNSPVNPPALDRQTSAARSSPRSLPRQPVALHRM